MPRPVKVFKLIPVPDITGRVDIAKVFSCNAEFHQFGLVDNDAGNSCVAIIEMADGSVHTVPVSMIQFTDKEAA